MQTSRNLTPTNQQSRSPVTEPDRRQSISGFRLSPDGGLVETLCQACLAPVQWAMATYVGDKREMASRCGTHPVCSTCGRPTRYLRSVFAVRPIGPEGLAS